jgi:hypothetical protein
VVRKIFIIFALVVITILIGFNIYLNKNKQVDQQSLQTPQEEITPTDAQSGTVITKVVASESTTKDSPDGKLTLLMKMEKGNTGTVYSFSVSGKEIFVKTVNPSTIISIPYNTWDPNGKYIFLKENNTTGTSFFVLSTGTSSLDQNDQTANITDLFTEKYPDLKIGDVTGWGGVNLVVINSIKGDGGRGPSFWFEMPTHSFIQLSMRFAP